VDISWLASDQDQDDRRAALFQGEGEGVEAAQDNLKQIIFSLIRTPAGRDNTA
jgi:hypothetical protein